jgi:hypothetical protein
MYPPIAGTKHRQLNYMDQQLILPFFLSICAVRVPIVTVETWNSTQSQTRAELATCGKCMP